MKPAYIIGVVSVAILGLIALVVFKPGNSTSTVPISDILSVTSTDHVKGPAEAKVTIVEYTDYQCPACASAQPLVESMLASYPNDVRLIVRDFPLTSIHPLATLAAQYAEASGKQGKYFEMGKQLFSTQASWKMLNSAQARKDFDIYAQNLGLNMEQFKKDIGSSEVKLMVENDRKGGFRLGVSGTPSFYVNGEKIQNPRSLDEWKAVIDPLLK